jgi:hypothetical protein
METTFVNSMDSAALAVVVPVVARGLRERSAELKKMAAMTAGNIFALVNEPRDMAPFVPVILPEVIKAMEHSHPDVRAPPPPAYACVVMRAGVCQRVLTHPAFATTCRCARLLSAPKRSFSWVPE